MHRTLVSFLLAAGCAARQPAPRVPPPTTVSPDAGSADATPAADSLAGVAPADDAPARPSGPRAISGALPTLSLEALRVQPAAVCARGTCRLPGRGVGYPVRPAAGPASQPPAWLWLQQIEPGAAVQLPLGTQLEVLGVGLVGEVRAVPLPGTPGDSTTVPVRPWEAFRRPQGGLRLETVGTSAAVLALVVATDPEGTPRAPLSAGPTRVVGFNTVEDLSWAAGAFHARIAFGAPEVSRASLEVLLGSEDAPVAEHTHPGSWELLAALTAAGTLVLPSSTTVDGGAPGEERAVSDGDVVQVPPAVRHRWAPVGSRPLVAVQVYAPAGPEQRFRALAGAAR